MKDSATWDNGKAPSTTTSRMMGPYEFKGTDRFEIQGRLGAGTSGEVFRVFDHKLKTVVALKTLHKTDPAAIYRFKREFRALADVNHPHLVQLYEMLSDGEFWFFTMELVEGLSFIDFTRSQPPSEMFDTARFYALPTPTAPTDPERLRQALRQLADGLCALHRAGRLHCDLKPSNILVEPSGRVVLLDFGLVKELFGGQLYETLDGEISGTPAYMSPEQAAGRNITPASDWYSVGVILYEALTGSIPFKGGFLKILTDKQRLDPQRPGAVAPGVPKDLSDLCIELLDRDPEARPSGESVLKRLGGKIEHASAVARSTSSAVGSTFVGRRQHLEALNAAYRETRKGRTILFFVHGSSGMGKSALIQRFMHQVRQDSDQAVLLTGRCYERESVPYKAFDSLIDVLSRFLRRLPSHEAEVLMPTNVLALARLFPALRRVQAVAGAQRRVLEIPDSRELRRRAFAALREMLARLADRRPVVLYIDDLQWGDRDSAALLNELLRPPDPPSVLVIAAYRSEERDTSPLLQTLLTSELASASTEVREVVVQELSPAEARELALDLLGESTGSSQALAETISRESEGSPFFIDELVRYCKAEAGFDDEGRTLSKEVERALSQRMSLERLISARLERLPPEARRLLDAIAIAGQPIDLEAARRAAGLDHETQAVLAILRGASLSRVRNSRQREELEIYHDRIRKAVIKRLGPEEQQRLHGRLATALEAAGSADPETLANHFYHAGHKERATEFAIAAAEQATDALAFDRAARLYRIALDLDAHVPEKARQLRVHLGNALTSAGRGAEAARAFLDGARGAMAAEALELRRRAAEQLLISGHIDEGMATIQTVLESIGLKMPETPRKALFSVVLQLLHLKLRGLKFKERDSTQISAEKLIEIDTCWSVSIGLGTVDTIRGMSFGKKHLLLALKAGEPYRVARALAIESAYSSAGGNQASARTQRLVREAMALAERVNHPHALGLANITAGMAAYLEGRWQKACDLLERGDGILRESCTGVTWELDTAIAYQLRSLLFIGDLGEIRRRLPAFLKDVREKGDLYAEVNLRSRVVWVNYLADDRPDLALDEVEDAIQLWSQKGFHIQHYWHLTGLVETALYRGDDLAAWGALEEIWPKMESSLLLRIQLTRTEARHLRCRGALAALRAVGVESAKGQALLKEIERDIRIIEKEEIFWADPLVHLVRAGLLALRHETQAAIDTLAAAAAGFDAADMKLYAAVSRRRRGQLLGDGGKRFLAEADEWIREQGVKNIERLCCVLAPGNWEATEEPFNS